MGHSRYSGVGVSVVGRFRRRKLSLPTSCQSYNIPFLLGGNIRASKISQNYWRKWWLRFGQVQRGDSRLGLVASEVERSQVTVFSRCGV